MPTFYSDIGANIIAPTMRNRNLGIKESAELFFATAVYTVAGTEAANDIIRLVKLKQGTIVVPHLCTINTNGLASTATVSIGDDDGTPSATRYSTALNLASATQLPFSGGAAALTPYTLVNDADSWITATLATWATPVAGRVLTARIAYLAAV